MRWTKCANSRFSYKKRNDQNLEDPLTGGRSYEKVLGFHRFWSVDDKDICT